MYQVEAGKKYEKMLTKLSSQKSFDEGALNRVIDILASGDLLPSKYKDHQLKGKLSTYRELHIKHDMLLVYYKNDMELILVLIAIGGHSSLFGY